MKIEDILNSLLSKEEIAHALSGQTRNNSGGDILSALGIFGSVCPPGVRMTGPHAGRTFWIHVVRTARTAPVDPGCMAEAVSAPYDHPMASIPLDTTQWRDAAVGKTWKLQ